MHSLSADERRLIRHLLATIGFRVGKALEGAPEAFRDFRAAPDVNTPGMLIRHMTRLLHLARTAFGTTWPPEPVDGSWREETARFFAALVALDEEFADGEVTRDTFPLETLLQGPLSDVLTHCGQVTMLRRLAGCPVRPTNFVKANVQIGELQPARERLLPTPGPPRHREPGPRKGRGEALSGSPRHSSSTGGR